MHVTIKVKIKNIPELKDVSSQYLNAVQYCVDKSFEHSVKHKFELHNLIYQNVRKFFGLKSQFTVNAIAKGFESYKSVKKLKGGKPVIKSAPLVFDKRLASFKWDCIRLATNDKRVDVSLDIADYYTKYSDWSFQTAMLIFKKGVPYLNITFSKDINIDNSNVQITSVGVDVGVNNLAVVSNGVVFSGYKTKIMQFQYLTFVSPYLTSQTCSNCQSVGSRYFDSFVCPHCNFSCQSDLNASFNLRRLSVMQPYSSCDDVKGTCVIATEQRAKSPIL